MRIDDHSDDAMARTLRRRRVRLGAAGMLVGMGLCLLTVWIHLSAWSQEQQAQANHHLQRVASDAKFTLYTAQVRVGRTPDPPPGLTEGLLEQMLIGEPQPQESPAMALSYWIAFAGVSFCLGGLRAFRRARKEERIARDERKTSHSAQASAQASA